MSWPQSKTAYRSGTDRAMIHGVPFAGVWVCLGDFARQSGVDVTANGSGEDGGGTAAG